MLTVLRQSFPDHPCEQFKLVHAHIRTLSSVSSGMVYEDAEKIYAEVRKEGKQLLEEAFGSLLHRSCSLDPKEPVVTSSQGNIVGINTTAFPRLDVVKIPLSGPSASKLRPKVVQLSEDGLTGYALMQCENGVGLSFSRGLFADCKAATGELFHSAQTYCWMLRIDVAVSTTHSGDFVLRNACVQLTIRDGRITSLIDKQLGYVRLMIAAFAFD